MANPYVSTQMKIIRGTYRKDRANPSEPTPTILSPTSPPPEWLGLTEEAKQVWFQVLPMCPEGVLTVLDCAIFGRWAELQVDRRELRSYLREHGRSVDLYDVEGNLRAKKSRPECTDLRACETEIRQIETAMGFTPVSRARVCAKPSPEVDPLDEELFGT